MKLHNKLLHQDRSYLAACEPRRKYCQEEALQLLQRVSSHAIRKYLYNSLS